MSSIFKIIQSPFSYEKLNHLVLAWAKVFFLSIVFHIKNSCKLWQTFSIGFLLFCFLSFLSTAWMCVLHGCLFLLIWTGNKWGQKESSIELTACGQQGAPSLCGPTHLWGGQHIHWVNMRYSVAIACNSKYI